MPPFLLFRGNPFKSFNPIKLQKYRTPCKFSPCYTLTMPKQTPLKFSWDTEKAARNEEKYGVSFEEAKSIFNDKKALLEKSIKTERITAFLPNTQLVPSQFQQI